MLDLKSRKLMKRRKKFLNPINFRDNIESISQLVQVQRFQSKSNITTQHMKAKNSYSGKLYFGDDLDKPMNLMNET